MRTPVALIIFRRPDLTERVFAEIAKAKPPALFVIADGPRPDRPSEPEECAAARNVVERVDWKCEVVRNYSDVNLGCGRRPATGISWVFEHVEEAIILEDDCLPHPTFFPFCEELLATYRHDERVMHISGNNLHFGRTWTPHSYYFSRWNHCWGWASWRRAWQHFDIGLELWPALRRTSWLLEMAGDARVADFHRKVFDAAHAGRGDIDFWDFQWLFACWIQHGLAIQPSANLVSNIGFGPGATHTTSASDRVAAIPATAMGFPLRHPSYMVANADADAAFLQKLFIPFLDQRPSWSGKLRNLCAQALPRPMRKSIARLRSRLIAS